MLFPSDVTEWLNQPAMDLPTEAMIDIENFTE